MAVIPKIICPPDDSIRCFRLIDPMSFGIVKGAVTEIAIPTKGVCIPVNRYEDKRMVLRKNSTVKLDISGIASYWDMPEIYEFIVDLTAFPDILSAGTQHTYSLYDENLVLIESFSFTVVTTFNTALEAAFNDSIQIKTLMTLDDQDTDTGSLTFAAQTSGVKYRHVFAFDTTGSGGSSPSPFSHPGNLIQKFQKYPEGRVKIILIIPEFGNVDTVTCGCSDSSGIMLSNTKYFQYAYASDVERNAITQTPIIAVEGATATSYAWEQSSTDHIGYHVVTGNMINMQTDVTKRALVENIQGYDITTDTAIGTGTATYINHVLSPTVTWKTAGEMNLFTGGQDVYNADMLYIETFYLKNPQDFDIPLRILIGA